MTLKDLVKLLRARWVTVCVTMVAAVLAAVTVTLLTTPLYQASTRLFVSAGGGASEVDLNQLYSGNLLSQGRVLSYTELLTGESLAQRTIDKLGLDMSAEALQKRVTATAKPNTILIDVKVLDESPVRARDIANALSDEFVAMVGELETPEVGSRPNARVLVVQRASIPDDPVIPKTARNIAVGLGLGVLLGIGLAHLRDYLDNSVKDEAKLEEITHAGLVGRIPLDKERRKEPAIPFERDTSVIAESFRKLRTNLQFLAVDNPPRLIVVTSSLPGEGKTTTAINIALTLAEAGHNVVLVDGDMRRPMVAAYLNVVGTVGLSTVLSGAADLSHALQKTGFPGLTVLASGPIPPNPSEILGSLAAKKVLVELRAQFDYVIVDSSPLLAVTDAAILATNSDGVLVIARFGRTKREQLEHAMRNLHDVGATPLGAVFTMTPARGNVSYSYSDYGGDRAPQPSLRPQSAKRGYRRRATRAPFKER
ncbi:protein tyrosine kinase [Mycolicibacterium moriokaense]|nr:protein tyrosine kinase [Mycolicibacterium moriokaense]